MKRVPFCSGAHRVVIAAKLLRRQQGQPQNVADKAPIRLSRPHDAGDEGGGGAIGQLPFPAKCIGFTLSGAPKRYGSHRTDRAE